MRSAQSPLTSSTCSGRSHPAAASRRAVVAAEAIPSTAAAASARAWPASAVSQTGDMQGWQNASPPCSTSSRRTEAQAVDAAGSASGPSSFAPSASNIITLLAIAG